MFSRTRAAHVDTWMVKWKEGGERIWRTTRWRCLRCLRSKRRQRTDAADGIRLREEGRKVEEREREGGREGEAEGGGAAAIPNRIRPTTMPPPPPPSLPSCFLRTTRMIRRVASCREETRRGWKREKKQKKTIRDNDGPNDWLVRLPSLWPLSLTAFQSHERKERK